METLWFARRAFQLKVSVSTPALCGVFMFSYTRKFAPHWFPLTPCIKLKEFNGEHKVMLRGSHTMD